MGTYDDTCNLTRLPIVAPEDVIAIVPREDWTDSTFKLQTHLGNLIREQTEIMEIMAGTAPVLKRWAERGYDAGRRASLIKDREWRIEYSLENFAVYVGGYDDCGWVVTDEANDNGEGSHPQGLFERPYALIKRSAFESMVGTFNGKPSLTQLYAFLTMCLHARIELFHMHRFTSQGPSDEMIHAIQTIQDVSRRELEKLIADWYS